MKPSRSSWITLAAVIVVASSVGCYTLLKHPRLQTEDDVTAAYERDHVSFADECASCHNAATMANHWRMVPPPARFISPRWDYYYDYPWWIPYYTNDHTVSTEEQKQRPFDRRHLSQPEETNPSQVSSPQSPPAPSTVVAKPVDSGNKPPAEQRKQEDSNKRDEKRSGESKGSERRTRKP